MALLNRLDNIYVVDTKMIGFDHYHAAYIVKGKEIALVDTGVPNQIEAVRAGIKAHGFSVSDISHIFITHSHPDHCGNVGPFLRESPKAKVYIHPSGAKHLIDPSIVEKDIALHYGPFTPNMDTLFGKMEPVPPGRIKNLKDGDVFDLGNGEKLKVIFAPGHQLDGIVILEEKNNGLFINDLVGNYLTDAEAHYPLNPPGSDNIQAIESLKKLVNLPVANLYLGHYGICGSPKQVMTRSINNLQKLIDIGIKCLGEGKPENIAREAYEEVIKPELEKLRPVRGEILYQHAIKKHIPPQMIYFAKYCQERLGK